MPVILVAAAAKGTSQAAAPMLITSPASTVAAWDIVVETTTGEMDKTPPRKEDLFVHKYWRYVRFGSNIPVFGSIIPASDENDIVP
jgi:hypothetical protein